jgi:hypothetical protein
MSTAYAKISRVNSISPPKVEYARQTHGMSGRDGGHAQGANGHQQQNQDDQEDAAQDRQTSVRIRPRHSIREVADHFPLKFVALSLRQ